MGYRVIAAAGAIGLIWWASHGSSQSNASTQSDAASYSDASSSDGGDPTDTGADTSGVKGGETYGEYATRRGELDGSAGTYEGYGCTEDCSGHQAGYEWARAHDITDESDCGGNSWSFQEGCVAYAQEQSGEDSDSATSSDDEDDDATAPSDDDDEDGPSSGS